MSNPAFPFINASSIITQFPYQEDSEWVSAIATMDNGMSFAFGQHDTVLRRFVVNYPMIQRDEVTVLENFFIDRRGRLGPFTFQDDSGTVWNNCRFDQDEFSVVYPQVNAFQTKLMISAEQN